MTLLYDSLIEILTKRVSVRRLKPDPIPEGVIEKILDAARWAMSGANAQPWEFIVVTDPEIKKRLFKHYQEELNCNYNFWMEQMRIFELRHPAYQLEGSIEEQLREIKSRRGWAEAPALIVIVGDGRKQWATVMGGHTFGRHQSHFTDGLAIVSFIIHLAAASMGLGSQWVTIHIEDGFKRILNIPDVMTLYTIIPIGYPDIQPQKSIRRDLSEMIHYNQYDLKKFLSNKEIIDYLRELRKKTINKYQRGFKKENNPSTKDKD